MTAETRWHKHRHVMFNPMKHPRIYRVLRAPLFKTRNLAREAGAVYYLSLLSILHRWTGLTLVVTNDD